MVPPRRPGLETSWPVIYFAALRCTATCAVSPPRWLIEGVDTCTEGPYGPLIHRPTGCECCATYGLVLVHRLVQLPRPARSAWQHLTLVVARNVTLASSSTLNRIGCRGRRTALECHGQCHGHLTYAFVLVGAPRAGDTESPGTSEYRSARHDHPLNPLPR